MNRTPRSASRRASRQFEANEPSPGCFDSVKVEDLLRLGAEVGQLGDGLACIRKAISYWLIRVWISGSIRSSASIPLSRLTSSTTCAGCSGRRLRGCRRSGRPPLRLEQDALEPAGQAAGRPLAGGDRLLSPVLPSRHQDDETGEVGRLGPESVEEPRAHARPPFEDRSAVHEGMSRVVVDLLGLHRPDDGRSRRRSPRSGGIGRRFPGRI